MTCDRCDATFDPLGPDWCRADLHVYDHVDLKRITPPRERWHLVLCPTCTDLVLEGHDRSVPA